MCVITFYIIPYAVPTRRFNRFRESQTTLQILYRIVTMTYSRPLLLHRFPDVFDYPGHGVSLSTHSIGLVENNKANHSTSKACYGAEDCFNVETCGIHPLGSVITCIQEIQSTFPHRVKKTNTEMVALWSKCRSLSVPKTAQNISKTT